MITDLVEKCAIAASLADNSHNGEPFAQNYRNITLAVIDALADGVSTAMVQAFRAQWANKLSKHGETIDAVCARSLSAAIRAAKSREDQ